MSEQCFAEKYPLHVELKARHVECKAVGDFLDWLDEQRLTICAFHERREEYYPLHESKERRVGEFMGIDPAALEAEKRLMLANLL